MNFSKIVLIILGISIVGCTDPYPVKRLTDKMSELAKIQYSFIDGNLREALVRYSKL